MDSNRIETALPKRWDDEWVRKRHLREEEIRDKSGRTHPEDAVHLPFHYRILKGVLKLLGLFDRGYQNFLDVQVVQQVHWIDNWPRPLDGLRILQLSDLHIDLDPALVPVLLDRLTDLEHDLAVITGDFWEGTRSSMAATLTAMESIIDQLGPSPDGLYGVLGNHDTLDLAVEIEKRGLELLNNEAVVLGKGEKSFALAGVDDAFFYETDDLERASARCPATLPKILLSHSPQLAAAASQAGFKLMLSGHTHGGQVCFPGSYALTSMKGIPKAHFRGPWKLGAMSGYTTTGAGACHVPARFDCPPEIVLHTLRTADPA